MSPTIGSWTTLAEGIDCQMFVLQLTWLEGCYYPKSFPRTILAAGVRGRPPRRLELAVLQLAAEGEAKQAERGARRCMSWAPDSAREVSSGEALRDG